MQIDLTDIEAADIVQLLRDKGAHYEWLASSRDDDEPSAAKFLRGEAAYLYALANRLERKAA